MSEMRIYPLKEFTYLDSRSVCTLAKDNVSRGIILEGKICLVVLGYYKRKKEKKIFYNRADYDKEGCQHVHRNPF